MTGGVKGGQVRGRGARQWGVGRNTGGGWVGVGVGVGVKGRMGKLERGGRGQGFCRGQWKWDEGTYGLRKASGQG